MITKEQEQRLRSWARANRECPRAKKGATLVFCESLRYYYDRQPEEDEQPPIKRSIPAAKGIDLADENSYLRERCSQTREHPRFLFT